MSSPPHHDHNIPNYVIENTGDELLDHDPWPFLQETDMEDLVGMEQYGLDDSSIFLNQEEHMPLMADLSIFEEERSSVQRDDHDIAKSTAEADQASSSSKKGERSQNRLKCVESTDHNIEDDDQVEPLPIADRNAKERVRRMKLNASYLSLGALLPDPRRSKKRWSAPIIIDKVVEYIPELENEIQKLTLKKQNMLITVIGNNNKHLDQHDDHDIVHDEAPSVMVHSVKRGEMIVQICMNIRRSRHDGENDPCSLSSVLHKVEDELGMCILDASSVSLSDHRVFTYHIHVQMDGRSSDGDEYYNNVEVLRAKVISWLAT